MSVFTGVIYGIFVLVFASVFASTVSPSDPSSLACVDWQYMSQRVLAEQQLPHPPHHLRVSRPTVVGEDWRLPC